jgi:DNA-binding NtrC family response regulator
MAEPTEPNRTGRPRGSKSFAWRAFFQHATTPVFVLGRDRRLRYANPACEALFGVKLADALGMVCSDRRHSSPLAAALAPTPEVRAGKPDRVRRAAPTARTGPPWWDIAFQPLAGEDKLFGTVGFITVVSDAVGASTRRVPTEIAALRARHSDHFRLDLFAGTSPASVRLLAQLRHAAESVAPLWLIGEPGTGKETAARVVHHAGRRKGAAFVCLDCAGLQPYLIDSLLFGHGGVLSADAAGTLYLKEPAALPRDLQQRFADVFLQNAPNAPRLVSGSTRTAAEQVAEGKLVADFHTVLSVLEVTVPPLRDRLADLQRFASRLVPTAAIAAETFDVLLVQPWRANLRELADELADAASEASGPVKPEHLPRVMRERAGIAPPPVPPKPLALDPILEAVEKRLIEVALRRANNHQGKAAELLGIFRTRLGRRIDALGLAKPGEPGASATGAAP